MDIAGRARSLERKIARSVEAAVDEFVGTAASAPLEIVHAALDRAEQQIQDAGRGRRIFPFNRVTVHVAAERGDKESRARIAALFDEPRPFAERLKTRLEAAGCRCEDVVTQLVFVPKPRREWGGRPFDVTFERVDAVLPPAPAAPAGPTRIRIAVVAGQTAQRAYAFSGGRIDIGRRVDVLDSKQRLIRTNHVAFTEDGPDVNSTVSRRHAHIAYSEAGREYRVYDDRSAHGTHVVRGGRTLPVPAGPRGVRVLSGDEILLGQARIRVSLEAVRK